MTDLGLLHIALSSRSSQCQNAASSLDSEKGNDEAQLPTRQSLGEILNRLGYCLKNPKDCQQPLKLEERYCPKN
jgi:hypothetical protein